MSTSVPSPVSTLIPLIGEAFTLAPSIISLITGLVHQQAPVAEAQTGPGTGPVRFADVFGFVMSKLTAAADAGQIDKKLPADDLVKMIIQAVVTSMQMSGVLGATAPAGNAVALTDRVITLTSGQSLVIQVK